MSRVFKVKWVRRNVIVICVLECVGGWSSFHSARVRSGRGRTHYQGFTISLKHTHHTPYVSSGRMITSKQRILSESTQLSENPVMNRTCNFRNRETVEPPLRLRWYWDRPLRPHKYFQPEVYVFSVFSSDISNTKILCCIKQTTIDSPYTIAYLFLFCSYVTKLY